MWKVMAQPCFFPGISGSYHLLCVCMHVCLGSEMIWIIVYFKAYIKMEDILLGLAEMGDDCLLISRQKKA
jgi:hypothetical protein